MDADKRRVIFDLLTDANQLFKELETAGSLPAEWAGLGDPCCPCCWVKEGERHYVDCRIYRIRKRIVAALMDGGASSVHPP